MKTLITGAAGFVGAAVLRELLKKGHKVKALVRQSSVLDNLKNLDVEIVQGDLKDRSSLKRCLKDCKYLFHVAADYRLWVPKPEEIYQNNVIGTENLTKVFFFDTRLNTINIAIELITINKLALVNDISISPNFISGPIL